ncbi:MAG: fasciclin domain-containing protein [Candidatus Nanopelagicales bacterium]
MTTRKTRITFIGLAAAASLTLAACGSSSSSESASSSPASQTPASSAPASPSASMSQSMSATAAAGDIVAVASANPTTTTLVTALDAAGLVTALQAPGPFTVFAPTDDAFAALPAGVLDKLVQPANKDALTKILTYHVVNGEYPSSAVKDGQVPTLEGQNLTISTANGVTVNGATVTTADVEASNGVIHLINQVLLPPGFDPATLQ